MPVFNNALAGAAGSGGDAGYEISRSLRFNSGDSAYLSKDFSVTGDRKTFTFSCWIKRCSSDGNSQYLFVGSNASGTTRDDNTFACLRFTSADQLEFAAENTSYRKTNAVFRDFSAWMHIVLAVDTTNSTDDNKIRLYVNGVEIESNQFATNNNPAQDHQFGINQSTVHTIGVRAREETTLAHYQDAYLADVHFIDGQQLAASDFGEPDDDGVWQPKEYTHADPVSSSAITNVNPLNNSGTQTVTAAGWQSLNNALDGSTSNKAPSNNNTAGTITFGAQLYGVTKVRAYTRFYGGGTARLYHNGSIVHQTGTINNSSSTQWYTIYSGPAITIDQYWQQMSNGASDDFWALEINNTIVTASGNGNNMTSSISSSVVELTTTDNSNYSSFTAGTAVNSAAKVVSTNSSTPSITVDAGSWSTGNTVTTSSNSFHLDFSDNSSKAALGTDSSGNSNTWTVTNISDPGGDYDYTTMMTQLSDGGYHSGAGSDTAFDGLTNTAPRTIANNNNGNITFTPSPSISHTTSVRAYWQHGNSGATYSYNGGSATSITASGWITLASGSGTFTSLNTNRGGDGNYFSAIEIDGSILINSTGADNDSLIDTPTNYEAASGNGGNYATLNPLESALTGLNNGNLNSGSSGAASWKICTSTLAVSSGKYYWEGFTTQAATESAGWQFGFCNVTPSSLTTPYGTGKWSYQSNSVYTESSSGTTVGTTAGANDLLAYALDMDAGTCKLYVNNSLVHTFTGITGTITPFVGSYSTPTVTVNFGQRPFAYTPPTGFKSLCTQNLPVPTIADGSTAFDIITYSGDGTSSRNLTLPLAADLVWIKKLSAAASHHLADTVRGDDAVLKSNSTDGEKNPQTEFSGGGISSISNTTVTIKEGTSNNDNQNALNATYVGWAWDAPTSFSNSAGSNGATIASTGKVNQSAGFSIVSYQGNGSTSSPSIGHGLNAPLGLVIIKNRDGSQTYPDWYVKHKDIGDNYNTRLNLPAGRELATGTGAWYQGGIGNLTSSSVITFVTGSQNSTGNVNTNGNNYIAYCFAPVEGYSAFGSYTGNGDTDGPFVFTGFRPRWIMGKRTDSTNDWFIYDTEREKFNVQDKTLYANLSAREDLGGYYYIDILSNGFKLRSSYTKVNGSSATYIYAAFAEHPFKTARAR